MPQMLDFGASEIAQLIIQRILQHLLCTLDLGAGRLERSVRLHHLSHAGILATIAFEQRWIAESLWLRHKMVDLVIAALNCRQFAINIDVFIEILSSAVGSC